MHRMTRWTRSLLSMFALLFALMATAPQALAHEKWFQETEGYPLRGDLLARPLPLLFVSAVLLVTGIMLIWWHARGRGFVPGPESFGTTDERRCALYGLVPLILGIHIAVPLLVNGVQGKLFSPDNALPGAWANWMGLVETGIALALFYGAFTRLAAVALAALWGAGVVLLGLEPMLDNTFYLGFAAFFFLTGRGPISVDRLLLPRFEPPAHLMQHAIPALRTGLGLSLVIVAFTEKFANIPLATAFLDKYPLNFTAALGIPLSNEMFILCAGAVELLAGLWILLGIFPREILIIAWVPINMTLTIFNWTELIGHLPIYGAMAVLLLWAPGRENVVLWVKGLREGPLAILTPADGEPAPQPGAHAERVARQSAQRVAGSA